MLEKVLDGLKGLIKLIVLPFYGLGYILYTPSKYVLNLKMSAEIKLEEEAKKKAELFTASEKLAPVKKRAPRKKKAVENVANEQVNN
jgi:hypothetical protein